MSMIESVAQWCPYCGEKIELLIDNSADQTDYTEDCQVCCQPMVISVMIDSMGASDVSVRREDD